MRQDALPGLVLDEYGANGDQDEIQDVRRLQARDAAREVFAKRGSRLTEEVMLREGAGQDKAADDEE